MNALEKYAAKRFLIEKLAGFANAQSYRAGKALVTRTMNARSPGELIKIEKAILALSPEKRKSVMAAIQGGRIDGETTSKNLLGVAHQLSRKMQQGDMNRLVSTL
tara:strand:- start:167 stop:481 length:315 start_codon:yes stop_codon:yes gene_type:complete